jgi:hypothetical protein
MSGDIDTILDGHLQIKQYALLTVDVFQKGLETGVAFFYNPP